MSAPHHAFPRHARVALALFAGSFLVALGARAADGDPFGAGIRGFDLGGSLTDAASWIAAAADGTIIEIGTATTGAGTWQLALTRFLPSGDPDPSFGTGGKVVNPFVFAANSWGTALHLLDDGRILVAGTLVFGGGDEDFYVGRLLTNGSPDTTFGGLGIGARGLAFDLGGDNTDTLSALALDRSGRILLVGTVDVSSTDTDFGVARFTADGLPSDTFSDDGWTTVPISTDDQVDLGLAIAVDADGRILLGGASWEASGTGNGFDEALAVLDSFGDIDPGFGTGGIVTLGFNMGGTKNEFVWDLDAWPDGTIVAVGDFATAADRWAWFATELPPDGSGFGGTIRTFCGFYPSELCANGPQDSARSVLLQGDGKFVVGGFARGPSGEIDFGAARLLRGGYDDTSFAADSTTTYDFGYGSGGGADHGVALAFDRDGRILVGGTLEFNGADTDLGWVRLDSSYIFADSFDQGDGSARWSATVD